jgi:arylsulfatase A-like enzyme
LEAAGIAKPKDMQGVSFLPLVTGKKAKGRAAIYYHYYENGEHSVSPHFGIRTERYKLIRFYKRVESWELFDLKNDSSEMRNIYGKKGYEEITATLKKQLDELIDVYEDDEAKRIVNTQVATNKKRTNSLSDHKKKHRYNDKRMGSANLGFVR